MYQLPQKEKQVHCTLWKPYSYYWNEIPNNYPNVPPHYHPEFELNYFMEGSINISVGNQSYRANAGDIFIVQPNVLHALYLSEGALQQCHYHTVVFHSKLLAPFSDERPSVEILTPIIRGNYTMKPYAKKGCKDYEKIKKAAENVCFHAKKSDALSDLALRSDLLKLFYLMLEKDDGYTVSGIDKAPKDLLPVIEYIEQHYPEQIDLKELADLSFLSPSRFMVKFKQKMGITVMSFVIQTRLHHVCEKLLSTNDNIIDIGIECGFRNHANFNRIFKKYVGYSPSEYRIKSKLSQQIN